MANLTTITDLIKDVLHRSGENPTDITGKYYNKSVEYINRARLDILKGKTPTDPDKHVNFRFAVSHPPKNLTLLPKITTGTVSVTNNSTTVTFSTAPNQLGADIDADGWYLYIDGEYDVYRIAAHTAAGTNATLDSVFTGTTAGTASYKLVKLEYDIGSSDILRLISPLRIHRYSLDNEPFIKGMPERAFDRSFPLREIKAGVPEAYKEIQTAENTQTVMMSRYSESDLYKVDIPYIGLPSDLTTGSADADILVPREYRYVISDLATYFLQRDKNDKRRTETIQLAQAGFEEMALDYEYKFEDVDNDFARIIAREDDPSYDSRLLTTDTDVNLG